MTFPTVASSSSGTSRSAGSTTHPVTLPSGITAGDRVIVFLKLSSASNIDALAGWAEVVDNSGTNANMYIAYRDCDGTEGATVTFTSPVSTVSVFACYRITGHDPATAPEASALAFATNGSPDPASLTPSWGAADTLWVACFAANPASASSTVSAYPTNYSSDQIFTKNTNAAAGGGCVATATRGLNAASEDPGAFTWGVTTQQWVAVTVGIRPLGAAGDDDFFAVL